MFCRSCQQGKDITEFPTRVQNGSRKYSRCKKCDSVATLLYVEKNKEEVNKRRREHYPKHKRKQKAWSLNNLYGISLAEWDTMFEDQDRKCAICFSDQHKGRGGVY